MCTSEERRTYHAYLLLAQLDGELEPREAHALGRTGLGWRGLRRTRLVVEQHLQLVRGARVVKQRGGELLALRAQLLVLRLELVFERGEAAQLPGELERCQDGVLGGERDERGRSERAVRVNARARVTQRVLAARAHALVAAAAHVVRHGQRRAAVQQQLDDLVRVAVRRQDQWRDVRRERGRLRRQRLPALRRGTCNATTA